MDIFPHPTSHSPARFATTEKPRVDEVPPDTFAADMDVLQHHGFSQAFHYRRLHVRPCARDRRQAFYQRPKPILPADTFPDKGQVAAYSAGSRYFKATKEMDVVQAKASGRAVVETMKRLPTDDDCFGPGSIRRGATVTIGTFDGAESFCTIHVPHGARAVRMDAALAGCGFWYYATADRLARINALPYSFLTWVCA